MKLTNEEIAKVFAMYWGCQVKTIHPNYQGYCINYGSNPNGFIHIYEQGEGFEFIHNNIVKLLLSPLSKISDEHAIEVAKIFIKNIDFKVYYRNEKYIEVSSKYYTLGIDCNFTFKLTYKDGILDRIDKPVSNYCIISTFQYLISQSYAVPLFFSPGHWANGKTAIELGIAIEKI